MRDTRSETDANEALLDSCPPCNGKCRQGRVCPQVQRWREEDERAMQGLVLGIILVIATVLLLVWMIGRAAQ